MFSIYKIKISAKVLLPARLRIVSGNGFFQLLKYFCFLLRGDFYQLSKVFYQLSKKERNRGRTPFRVGFTQKLNFEPFR